MIIKMVNEFKLTVVHFAPNPMHDLWMRVDLPLDKKTVKNQDRATGPAFSKTYVLRALLIKYNFWSKDFCPNSIIAVT